MMIIIIIIIIIIVTRVIISTYYNNLNTKVTLLKATTVGNERYEKDL